MRGPYYERLSSYNWHERLSSPMGSTPPGNAARARPPWRRLDGAAAARRCNGIGPCAARRRARPPATGPATDTKHPRRRSHYRLGLRYGPGWRVVRSFASRAMISSDIRRKSPIVRVPQQQRDRRPTATPSRSRRAFRFWITTVRRAPKLSRRTSPKRPGGPIATCLRPRRLPSPKAPAQGNDATGLNGSTPRVRGRPPGSSAFCVVQDQPCHRDAGIAVTILGSGRRLTEH